MPSNVTNPTKASDKRFRPLAVIGWLLLAVFLLIGGFLSFLTIVEYRPAPVEPAAIGGSTEGIPYRGEDLQILTFNTGYASLGRDADFILDGGTGTGHAPRATVEENLAGMQEILQKTQADFYFLQEVDLGSDRTFNIDHISAYEDVLPAYNWSYAPNYLCKFVPYPVQDPIRSIDSGIVTYSRFATASADRVSLSNPFSWPVRTANLKRCLLVNRYPIENSDAELVTVNFHMDAYDSGDGKEAQTLELWQLLSEEYEKGNYVIAGGDFNQTFPDMEVDVIPSANWVPGHLTDPPENCSDWSYVHDGSVPTCRLLNQPYIPDDPLTQYYVIDGFIVSPNVEVKSIETLDENFRYADHNPLLLDVHLKF